MCGIAGVVSRDPTQRSTALVERMLRTLEHRGPDEEGLGADDRATIGARRLAIIDLKDGRQPATNETGDVLAIQNGEIYNYLDIRAELDALGHRFHTRNDTEVLPHAYEEWGPDFVKRLRGMFALAVWDRRTETLVLARDRFGKKPVLYSHRDRTLVFASEVQALLAHPAVRRSVDDEAIDEYLTLGYVPAPRTAFADIRKLEPGHTLVFRDGQVRTERYWRLEFEPKLRISREEAADELRRRIDEAVRIRLMSDVPIGAFLSGGLDSTTVVAFMAKHSERPVKTFSIGFGEPAYDERAYARMAAEAFGTDHHELVVDASNVDVLPMLVRHVGEPFADSSIVPTYHVARITRTQVTVALNGDGGDELFAGYDRYRAAAIARLTVGRLPAVAGRAIARAAELIPLGAGLPRGIARTRRFLSAFGTEPEQQFLRWSGYFTGALRASIVGPRLEAAEPGRVERLLRDAADLAGAQDPAERAIAGDIALNLAGDLLVKMDIAAMAASLEPRSPLLDHELAEFVARLPVSFKLSPTTTKVLLRQAMRGILPEPILRRGKMGFSAPVGAWLRGPLRDMVGDLLSTSSLAAERGYIDPSGVRQLVADHDSGRADRTRWLWSLLMLELWFRELVVPTALHVPPVVSLAE